MKTRFVILCFVLGAVCVCEAATPDARIRKVPQEIAEKVFDNPNDNIVPLVAFLTAGTSEVRPKIKALHDWICDNIAYDTDIFIDAKLVPEQSPKNVLKKRSAVCAGYANLFYAMCKIAKIECISISGWSKGFGYDGKLDLSSAHAWNAVKVSGKWYLIDCTWDAGFVDFDVFVKHYSTQWFMRSGNHFIWSHLPEETDMQFLTKIKTPEEFVSEPYVEPVFFDLGLSLPDDAPRYENDITADTTFRIKASDSSVVLTSYMRQKNGPVLPHYVWYERNDGYFTVTSDVPDDKLYRIVIRGGKENNKKIPISMTGSDFNGRVMPEVNQMLAENKITQDEYDMFADSFFVSKVSSNVFYKEDFFDKVRTNTVTKIFKMSEYGLVSDDTLLYFDVKAADGYDGCGTSEARYPCTYYEYAKLKNIHIVSPLNGVLQRGSTQKIMIQSKSITGFAIGFDGGDLIPLKKGSKPNLYELEFSVPEDAELIDVYGATGKNTYWSHWYYLARE